MSESNAIIANQGLSIPENPDAFGPRIDSEFAQSGPRNVVQRAADVKSTSFETLAIYFKIAAMSIIQTHLEDDEIFRFIPGNPKDSGCVITTAYNRKTIEARDHKPLIAVIGQGMQPQEVVLRNAIKGAENVGPMREERGVVCTLGVRVAIIHHNPNITDMLGGFIQAWLAADSQLMREMFKFQKIHMPALSPTGAVEELPDVFSCNVTLNAEAIPRWIQTKDQRIIRRIYGTINANMGALVQEFILPTDAPG